MEPRTGTRSPKESGGFVSIDEARAKIAKLKAVIKALDNQIPFYQQRDKCGLRFRFHKLESGDWTPAVMTFEASHGSYGCSSASNDMSPELAEFVVRAVASMEREIIRKAQWLAKVEATQLAAMVQTEAENILKLAREELAGKED